MQVVTKLAQASSAWGSAAPIIAMAGNPPDPVERWILGACATRPKPEGTPDIQATLLYAGLTLAGAMQLRDFEGLTSTEAIAIWPHLGGYANGIR